MPDELMTFTLEVPAEEAGFLKEQASEHGQNVDDYVSSVLKRLAEAHRENPDSSLEEKAFRASGSEEGSSW